MCGGFQNPSRYQGHVTLSHLGHSVIYATTIPTFEYLPQQWTLLVGTHTPGIRFIIYNNIIVIYDSCSGGPTSLHIDIASTRLPLFNYNASAVTDGVINQNYSVLTPNFFSSVCQYLRRVPYIIIMDRVPETAL